LPHKHKQADAYERVLLLGNPNVGKSAIFGLLTGKYATVSNYPGTSVEVMYGNISLDGRKLLVVDTPGVNSLLPMSEDEQVTRDMLLKDRPSLVVVVGDAKNLRRTLAITAQVAEMGLPAVLDLNMQDEARDRGITIDQSELARRLGIEVVGTVAPERKGLGELKAAILKGPQDNLPPSAPPSAPPAMQVRYHPVIEEYIEKIVPLLPGASISARSLAVMVLAGDETLREWLTGNLEVEAVRELETLMEECRDRFTRPVSVEINEARLGLAGELARAVVTRAEVARGSFAVLLGRLSIHPLWGLPVLLVVLMGMYGFVGVLGAGMLVDLMEKRLFGEYLNPMFHDVIGLLLPVAFLRDMLVGPYGLITMALTYAIGIVLPITTTFFIAFSVLEDSGYLPRLAIMSNRVFSRMGLSGKAVLPMVLGLGCGTMAVMTTRILERRRERIIATFLLALAVPCAAQLGVIMGVLGGLSPWAMGIWLLSVLGTLVLAGYLASLILPGERSDFFLEIPPIRAPSIGNVLVKTYGRAVWYLKEAVPLFMLGTLALFVLDKLGALGALKGMAAPVVTGVLGLPEETAEIFLIGFFRRDYGAAGFYAMAGEGLLSPVETLVGLVTITLFVPCLAHFFMMIKERGLRLSLLMMAIIIPLSIAVGGGLNWVLRTFNITL
jgi:ferrous iron transport protein B